MNKHTITDGPCLLNEIWVHGPGYIQVYDGERCVSLIKTPEKKDYWLQYLDYPVSELVIETDLPLSDFKVTFRKIVRAKTLTAKP